MTLEFVKRTALVMALAPLPLFAWYRDGRLARQASLTSWRALAYFAGTLPTPELPQKSWPKSREKLPVIAVSQAMSARPAAGIANQG
jgi:hypothetical protein